MSVTSGFFNSLNGDRKYNAQQMSEMIDSIIYDGIFEHYGDKFTINVTSGNTISIGVGRAWFKGLWLLNDSELLLDLHPSEALVNRWDAIVIEMNSDPSIREGTIKVINGTPQLNPTKPAIIKSEKCNQYPLAYVYRPAGQNSILKTNLTNMIGTTECPYVDGILEKAQWENWTKTLDSKAETSVEAYVKTHNGGFATEQEVKDLGTSNDNIPEYMKVIRDGNENVIFSIDSDGNIDWAQGIPKPIKNKLFDDINDNEVEFSHVITGQNGEVLFSIDSDGSVEMSKIKMNSRNKEYLYNEFCELWGKDINNKIEDVIIDPERFRYSDSHKKRTDTETLTECLAYYGSRSDSKSNGYIGCGGEITLFKDYTITEPLMIDLGRYGFNGNGFCIKCNIAKNVKMTFGKKTIYTEQSAIYIVPSVPSGITGSPIINRTKRFRNLFLYCPFTVIDGVMKNAYDYSDNICNGLALSSNIYGDAKGQSSTTKNAAHSVIENVVISGFDKGMVFNSNTYMIEFNKINLSCNRIHIETDTQQQYYNTGEKKGLTNAGERITFNNCNFGGQSGINNSVCISSFTTDGMFEFTFNDCSFDWINRLYTTNSFITFNNCHIESPCYAMPTGIKRIKPVENNGAGFKVTDERMNGNATVVSSTDNEYGGTTTKYKKIGSAFFPMSISDEESIYKTVNKPYPYYIKDEVDDYFYGESYGGRIVINGGSFVLNYYKSTALNQLLVVEKSSYSSEDERKADIKSQLKNIKQKYINYLLAFFANRGRGSITIKDVYGLQCGSVKTIAIGNGINPDGSIFKTKTITFPNGTTKTIKATDQGTFDVNVLNFNEYTTHAASMADSLWYPNANKAFIDGDFSYAAKDPTDNRDGWVSSCEYMENSVKKIADTKVEFAQYGDIIPAINKKQTGLKIQSQKGNTSYSKQWYDCVIDTNNNIKNNISVQFDALMTPTEVTNYMNRLCRDTEGNPEYILTYTIITAKNESGEIVTKSKTLDTPELHTSGVGNINVYLSFLDKNSKPITGGDMITIFTSSFTNPDGVTTLDLSKFILEPNTWQRFRMGMMLPNITLSGLSNVNPAIIKYVKIRFELVNVNPGVDSNPRDIGIANVNIQY